MSRLRGWTRIALLALVGGAGGCRSGSGSGNSDGGSVARDWSREPAVFTLAGTREIDVVGDPHGDLAATVRVLAAGGLVARAPPNHWIGGTRVLVITGDIIDKGVAALPVIDFLIDLETQARAANGAVVVTLGNHEAEFLAEPTGDKSRVFQDELTRAGLDPVTVAAGGSRYGAWLLGRPVAALIDGWFFSHAGNSDGKAATTLGKKYRALFDQPPPPGQARFDDSFLVGSNSLLEAEHWWKEGNQPPLQLIDAYLAALPAQHIVFGHDPGALDFPGDASGDRARGKIVARYGGRLFLVDVGMSYAVAYSDGALLRITRNPDLATAIYPDGTSSRLWP